MAPDNAFLRLTQLDRTTFPELRDQVLQYEQGGPLAVPRAYPGYPCWPLDRARSRVWPPLDQAIRARRSVRKMSTELPERKTLSRLLEISHGIHDSHSGSIPSAGGLQALELYLVIFNSDGPPRKAAEWPPAGLFHYDRTAHHLSQLKPGADRHEWQRRVPSMEHVQGGSILFIIVGDGQRVEQKYLERGHRFLLLEAGHLMQNLCVVSSSLGLSTVPMGGCYEGETARAFDLLASDQVLYAAICGKAN